jgi:hypothetical protein
MADGAQPPHSRLSPSKGNPIALEAVFRNSWSLVTTPTPTLAEIVAASVPLCDDCLTHEGLCIAHAPSVLPQLAQPHWYRLVGHTLSADKPLKEESAPVLKAKRRTARRLARAMNGEFTRSRRAA